MTAPAVTFYRWTHVRSRADALQSIPPGWTPEAIDRRYGSVLISAPALSLHDYELRDAGEGCNARTTGDDMGMARMALRLQRARWRLFRRRPRTVGLRSGLAALAGLALSAALFAAAGAASSIARGIERDLAETIDGSPVGAQAAVTVRAVDVQRRRVRRNR